MKNYSRRSLTSFEAHILGMVKTDGVHDCICPSDGYCTSSAYHVIRHLKATE
jgi:hypothetical protein